MLSLSKRTSSTMQNDSECVLYVNTIVSRVCSRSATTAKNCNYEAIRSLVGVYVCICFCCCCWWLACKSMQFVLLAARGDGLISMSFCWLLCECVCVLIWYGDAVLNALLDCRVCGLSVFLHSLQTAIIMAYIWHLLIHTTACTTYSSFR